MTTANHQTGECSLPDCFCHEAQRLASSSSSIAVPTFEQEWHNAPKWATRTTEEVSANYWFIRGQHAKEVELLAGMNGDLREMIRVARERVER